MKAKQIAEKANQTKMQFLSNMSHEIRTPMNAVIGITDMMLDEIEEPFQKENLSLIKRSADNLLVIINDILDISKIESGKVEIDYIDFNLIELIEQLIRTFKFKADKKGINFHYSFQRNTPEYLHGDPVRLNQILVNLIGNAVKFTEKGEVKLEILVGEIDNNYVKLKFKVIDTGIGTTTPIYFDLGANVTVSPIGSYGGVGTSNLYGGRFSATSSAINFSLPSYLLRFIIISVIASLE